MTKKELVNELHRNGCFWASESLPKKELETYLRELEDARSMTTAELFARVLGGIES